MPEREGGVIRRTGRTNPRGWRLLDASHAIPWRKHKRIMRRHKWHLTPEASAAFLDALLNPPMPSAKAREAARRYKEMFGHD